MEPVTEWRIHIGAHKTATTHLQDSLALQRSLLTEAGVDFIPRFVARDVQLVMSLRRSSWRRIIPERVHARRWQTAIAVARSGPPTIVLSDENIAGGARDLLGGTFYPQIENRLRALASLVRGARLNVFLSIRSLETLLPAAYAQSLRGRRVRPGFDPIRKAFLRRPPSWEELIARIRSTIPEATLRVWTFEDYRTDDVAIMSALCGVRGGIRDMRLPPPKTTMTPSAEAIAKIERISRWRRGSVYQSEVNRICSLDTASDRYSPLSMDESAALSEAYARDLDLIRSRHPSVLLPLSIPASGIAAKRG